MYDKWTGNAHQWILLIDLGRPRHEQWSRQYVTHFNEVNLRVNQFGAICAFVCGFKKKCYVHNLFLYLSVGSCIALELWYSFRYGSKRSSTIFANATLSNKNINETDEKTFKLEYGNEHKR